MARLMSILQFIIGSHSQSIDFTNVFNQNDTTKGGQVFISVPSHLKINRDKYYVIIRYKKILYGQSKATCLWYEKMLYVLLSFFLLSMVYLWFFMSKTMICVAYMDNILFCVFSKYYMDKVMKSFKEDAPIYNWKHSQGESVFEFLGIDINMLGCGRFKFPQTGLIQKVVYYT